MERLNPVDLLDPKHSPDPVDSLDPMEQLDFVTGSNLLLPFDLIVPWYCIRWTEYLSCQWLDRHIGSCTQLNLVAAMWPMGLYDLVDPVVSSELLVNSEFFVSPNFVVRLDWVDGQFDWTQWFHCDWFHWFYDTEDPKVPSDALVISEFGFCSFMGLCDEASIL